MASLSQTPPHPIIVVTGANTGVGFAICQRLLAQLSCPLPPDVFPRSKSRAAPPICPFTPTKRLTLILACRSAKRANAARQLLLSFMDAEVSRQKKSSDYNGHAEEFRCGLNIDHLSLDLASMESVFQFAEETRRQYPYITHLILNAGIFGAVGLDWNIVVKQFLVGPVAAVTAPRYVIQPVGSESPDGLGLVWQSNVFGHYCLARLMEPLLLANPYRDSRIEWLTSIDPEAPDPSDLQLRLTKFPYQASKYQVDLICAELSRLAAKKKPQEEQAKITHFSAHPGVCHTKLASDTLGFFLVITKILSFYLARLLGSQNHPRRPYKGAIAPVYVSLAPAAILEDQCSGALRKFGSRCTLFAQEYVGIDPVPDWEETKYASDLVRYCEKLFLTFRKARGDTASLPPVDSGIEYS